MDIAHFQLVSFLHVLHAREARLRGYEATNTDLHLIHVMRGRAMMRVGDQTMRIEAPQAMCIAPRVPYRMFDKAEDEPLEMFNFHCHVAVEKIPLSYFVELPLMFRPKAMAKTHARLRRWYDTWQRGRAAERMTIAGHLHALLGEYVEQFGRPRALPSDTDMLHLRGQLERDADEPFDAERYATTCAMSVSQMNRRFRATFGSTPRAYWQQARYARLCERLASTDETIDRIAADMGFTDRFHMTRWFKQQSGSPPATYRRRMRQMEW